MKDSRKKNTQESKIQREMVQGFKNEENARQLVQKELAVMKDEQWQHCVRRGQHRDGTGVWCLRSATATHISIEWNCQSTKDGIRSLGH